MFRSVFPGIASVIVIYIHCFQISLCVNETCTTSPDSCTAANSVCDGETSKCQCAEGFYSLKTADCASIEKLRVTALHVKSSTASSVTVQWTEPADRAAVFNYLVSWQGNSSGAVTINAGSSEALLTDLRSDVVYTVTVTTHISHLRQTTAPPSIVVWTKKKLNQECTSSTDCGPPHAECVIKTAELKVCRCTAAYYKQDGMCREKKALGKQCGDTGECGSTHGECLKHGTLASLKTCQCMIGYYLNDKRCRSVKNLKVTGIEQTTSTTTSVTVQWQEPADVGQVFAYIVTWRSTSGVENTINVNAGTNRKEIRGLLPGTVYSVNVTTHVSHLGQKTTQGPVIVKTKKSLEGGCVSNSECGTENADCRQYYNSKGLKKCQCRYQYYPLSGLCELKKPLDRKCSTAAECGTPNAGCLVYDKSSTTVKTCQCSTGYYPVEDRCKGIANLKVRDLKQTTSSINTITVQWEQPTDISAVLSYTIDWQSRTKTNSGKLDVDTNYHASRIPVPYPGHLYGVKVTTMIVHLSQTIVSDIAVVATKLTLDQKCTKTSECGVPNSACLVVTDASGWRKCRCTAEYYPTTTNCQKKKDLYATCTAANECKTAHSACLAEGTGGLLKCLCSAGYYLLNNVCKSINNLVVTDLRQNSSNLNSVIVQWVNPADLAAVSSYIVHWSGHQVTGKKAVKSDTSQIELGGFPPGMDYQVTVTTQILHLGQTIASPAIMARTQIKYNATCTDEFVCSDPNSYCSVAEPRRCLCVANYYWDSSRCLLAPDLKGSDIVRRPSDTTLSANSFSMVVCPSCLYRPTTGPVSVAGVLVYRENIYNKARRRRRELRYDDYYKVYTNWTMSNKTGFEIPYRATNDGWVKQGSDLEVYTIGSTNCSQINLENITFCNGLLPRATKYIVVLFTCTNDGCRESDGVPFATKSDAVVADDHSAVVGLAVFAAILFILLVILAGVLFWCSRRQKPTPRTDTQAGDYDAQEDEYEIVKEETNGRPGNAQKKKKNLPPVPEKRYEELNLAHRPKK